MINKNNKLSLPFKQPPPAPFIELEVSTWSKDSHALYDYETTDNRFFNQVFQINKNCKVYRHVTSMKTVLHYEDQKKDIALQNIYIASIVIEKQKKQFLIQSADVSGVQPHAYLRQEHPNIFRNSFLVIQGFQKDEGVDGFPLCMFSVILEAGKFLKLGRVEYQVIEIKQKDTTKTLKQTSHLELNKQIFKVSEQLEGSCRICLCEQSTQEDPLINPCGCRGSCELIHMSCLKNWINSKVKKDVNGIAVTYNFSKFECEICKVLFPKSVELKSGIGIQMITFEKPERPYIVLQSTSQKYDRQNRQRNLHVISPEQNQQIKLGRGHQCQIRITDISVSRVHAQIRHINDKFYVKDLQSKFGTLIKFRQEIILNEKVQKMRIQYGRTCLNFKAVLKDKTKEELLTEEYESRPKFYTRAQLREMGQLQQQEQDDY